MWKDEPCAGGRAGSGEMEPWNAPAGAGAGVGTGAGAGAVGWKESVISEYFFNNFETASQH